jgi:hypothetical protein
MADTTDGPKTPENIQPTNTPHHETPRVDKRTESMADTTVDPRREALLRDIDLVPEIPVSTFLTKYLPDISKFDNQRDFGNVIGINHEQRSKQLLDDIRSGLQTSRHITNNQWRYINSRPSKSTAREPETFNDAFQTIADEVITMACDLLKCPKRLAVHCDGSRALHSERTDECKPDGVIHLAGGHVKHKAAAPAGQESTPHREDVAVVLEFKKKSDYVSTGLLLSLEYAT